MHSIGDVEELPTTSRYKIPPGPLDAIRLAPRTYRRIFWNLFWLVLLGITAWYLSTQGAMELALFLWVVFATLNVGLMYYMACVIASKRSGLQIPQILIDPDGIAEVGLFHFEFSAWTDLSDMAVATKEDDTGTTYGLVAFAKGEPVPDQHEDRIRLAKLKLSLPGLREISSDTIEIYSDLCRYLNAWRRHVLEGGPIPNRWRLQGVDELVEVTALSRAELDASWRAIRARY